MITKLPIVNLKKDEERRLYAGHLWIYSNEINNAKTPLKHFSAGDLVRIENHQGKFLANAYLNPNTLLAARVLSWDRDEEIDTTFFITRITRALQLRTALFGDPFYRLVYGESDGLPGLVVDRFGDVLVIQISTQGMERLRPFILEALIEVLKPSAIIARDDASARVTEGLTGEVNTVHGTAPEYVTITENGVQFQIPVLTGQKTGWFYDHRENRARLQNLVKGKRVLDVFSYIGGWGIQAAKAGASSVTCIDSSEQALACLNTNAKLNQVTDKIATHQQDAFAALDALVAQKEKFDVVVLDPPALIKRRKDMKAGEGAYLHLNQRAFELLGENGVLVSASCSLHLAYEDLINIVRKAGNTAHKQPRVIAQGHQGPDHPVHPAISETNYLKALFVVV